MSAGSITFQNDGFEALRGGINRRCQAGRTCADNNEIALNFALILASRIAEKARDTRDFTQGWAAQWHAVRGNEGWQIAASQMEALAQALAILAL